MRGCWECRQMKESVLNNKRILAVDDEPDVLETLGEQLEEFPGLVFEKATDYETGYHLLRSWTYDLVILDIMGVRGFDLLNASVSLGFPTVMLNSPCPFSRSSEAIHTNGCESLSPEGKDARDRFFS